MIGHTVSHYRILEQIGRGGMGTVYKAEDLRLKRSIALKFLPVGVEELDRKRFLREAQALAKLDRHENICTVYEIDDFEIDGELQTFIAMQYLRGKSLKEKLAGGMLMTGEALRIWGEVARGLRYAHEQGIVHRDIKPGNIIVTDDERAKIVDFGLALMGGTSDPEKDTITALSTGWGAVGTPEYMSPEQIRGFEVDYRTDIWSLGVVAYEMLTGSRPFSGPSTLALLYSIANEQPRPVESLRPDLPDGVIAAVRRSLAKLPADRYGSLDEMIEDLCTGHEAGMTAGFAVTESVPSIAVLPFVDMSREQDQAYLCEGIAEEIINVLMQIGGLRTVGRGSSFRFSSKSYDVAQVRRALMVDSILEGSVRSSADRVRITVQLIDAVRGFQIWSKRFDRRAADVFELQDDIARAVAKEMQVTLGRQAMDDSARRHSENVEAYHLYLKGRHYWNSRLPDKVQKAIEQFRAALDIDPGYALAHAGLADAFITPGYYGTRPPHQVMPQARASAMKALELAPRLAEAHTTLGMVSSVYDYDWVAGEGHFRTAIASNPGYALARTWYAGFHLVAVGRFEEAISHARRAQELDPLTPAVNTIVGACLFFMRDYDGAVRELERAVELEPNFPVGLYFLGRAYWHSGSREKAVQMIELGRTCYDLPLMAGHLGYCYAASGQAEKARDLLDSLTRRSGQTYIPAASRAPIYLGLGENDQAVDWLDRAFEDERSFYLLWIGADPIYDAVRDDPRFRSILKKMKLA